MLSRNCVATMLAGERGLRRQAEQRATELQVRLDRETELRRRAEAEQRRLRELLDTAPGAPRQKPDLWWQGFWNAP